MSTVSRNIRVDFGLIEERNNQVVRFREKPTLSHLVSIGFYCLEPEIVAHIPDGVPFGFDDLMFRMLEHGLPVRTFLHNGFWLDIGRVEDFQKAQELGLDQDAPAYESAPLSLETLETV